MGEMDNNLLQLFYNGKPLRQGNFGCGTIPKLSPTDAQRFASAKAEMDAMAEKYKPIADKLVEEIYESSQKPIELLSEEMAKSFEKSCNDYFETLSEVTKSLNPCLERLIEHFGKTSQRKARKHYKPKFTL